jgi:hypothetical protein
LQTYTGSYLLLKLAGGFVVVGFKYLVKGGFGMRAVLRIRDMRAVLRILNVYPGSEFLPSRIRIFSIPDPGFASKNLSIFNPKKIVFNLTE